MVVADRMHGGARHLTLQTEQGDLFLVPEWMTQSDAAAIKVVEGPRISVAQLRALRAFLDFDPSLIGGERRSRRRRRKWRHNGPCRKGIFSNPRRR